MAANAKSIPKSSCPACPRCDHAKGSTKDSRPSHDLGFSSVKRRILCSNCGLKFTTREVSEFSLRKFKQELLTELLENINKNFKVQLMPLDAITKNPDITEIEQLDQ